jgi:hypothetical protein
MQAIRIWYILIEEKAYGPYTRRELKKDVRVVRNTLTRKEGESNWKPIIEIPELQGIFEERAEEKQQEIKESEEIEKAKLPKIDDELVLGYEPTPPFFLFWILLTFITFVYFYLLLQR